MMRLRPIGPLSTERLQGVLGLVDLTVVERPMSVGVSAAPVVPESGDVRSQVLCPLSVSLLFRALVASSSSTGILMQHAQQIGSLRLEEETLRIMDASTTGGDDAGGPQRRTKPPSAVRTTSRKTSFASILQRGSKRSCASRSSTRSASIIIFWGSHTRMISAPRLGGRGPALQ